MLLPHSLRYRRPSGAFTLVELLVVTAIIALIASISAATLNVNHRVLPKEGIALADLVSLAQQSALARNRSVALVYATNTEGKQGFGLFELVLPNDNSVPTPQDWKQVGNWSILSSGVAFDHNPQISTFMASPSISPELPQVSISGKNVQPQAYQVFLPASRLAGGISNGPFPRLRLVEGVIKGDEVLYTARSGSSGQPRNFYDVLINPATGRPIVERP